MAKFKESKLYLGWIKLLSDLKPMTAKQRIEHIWMYYKEYMFIAFVVLMLVVAVITSMITASQDVLASGLIVNIYIDQEGFDYLSTDYFQRLEGQKGREKVSLEYIYFGDPADPTDMGDSYSKIEAIVARVSGEMLDYMILDQFAMETFIMYDVYMDLRDFFTAEELAELDAQGRVIYAMQEGQEDRWPIAVDISDTAFARDNVNSEGKTYFALSGSTPRPEICRDVWQYIHQWQPVE